MAIPGEKRRLRALLRRPAIHPGWLAPEPPSPLGVVAPFRPGLNPGWSAGASEAEPEPAPSPAPPGMRALSGEQVRAIRADYRRDDPFRNAWALADYYGVSAWTILNTVRGRTYRDVV